MLVLNHRSAHKFVREQRRLGNDVRWDGWDILIFSPTHHGFTNQRGAFRNGRWGMQTRITVDEKGLWKVPGRHVKSPR